MNRDLSFPHQPPVGSIQPPIVYVKDKIAWEYKQVKCNLAKEDAPAEKELNALGADGWELVGMFTDSPFVYFYFKRFVD